MSLLSILRARRDQAIQVISEVLEERTGFRLLPSDHNECPPDTVTWQGVIKAAGRSWEIYVYLTDQFPDEPPRVRVPAAADLVLRNPHVLENGDLCTVPDSASIDSSDPVGLLRCTVDSVRRILEDRAEADFRDEFSVYWQRGIEEGEQRCLVIDSPENLPTNFHVLFGERFILVSKSSDTLDRWARNYLDGGTGVSTNKDGVLLELEGPLLPEEYPKTLFDLLTLSKKMRKVRRALENHIVSSSKRGFILLAQKTDAGHALAGVSYPGLGLKTRTRLHDGFRRGKTPQSVLVNRSFPAAKRTKVHRHSVERVDHGWVHARGNHQGDYQTNSVLVIGCGSLGGYVAHFLARAGVSGLTLVDKECLEWANLGRHILGAESVYRFKAEALGESLCKQMPHLQVTGIAKDWRHALGEDCSLFYEHDLAVVTTGDWRCESPLNILAQKGDTPPMIFGWLEPYAVAGHCLVSVAEGGCLACGMNRFGQFDHRVGDFEGTTLVREPGGCAHYQQYGPTALLPVASLISSEVLECLSDPPGESRITTWVSSERHFSEVGASISRSWSKRIQDEGYEKMYPRTWEPAWDCRVCA